jgi:hypothetical protein
MIRPLLTLILTCSAPAFAAEGFDSWTPFPKAFTGASLANDAITLQSGRWNPPSTTPAVWAYSLRPGNHTHLRIRTTLQIVARASDFGFFGAGWSVWPDQSYGARGFEAGILLRFNEIEDPPGSSGYRIQLSHKYQQLAIAKFPDGGFLHSVPCKVNLDAPHRIEVVAAGTEIVVSVDAVEKVRFVDHVLPITSGQVGLGASSKAKVIFSDVEIEAIHPEHPKTAQKNWLADYRPDFRVRKWIGNRPWLFDRDEPVMLLPTPKERYINNVKLRPGFKPLLSWNSHWGVENQGAYKEAENVNSEIREKGGGETIEISWSGEHVGKGFDTQTTMTAGWDAKRRSYSYDIDSTLEVRPGKPFHFRYGYDFEHHTPLDPFRWQNLLIKPMSGSMTYRPLAPFDPGPMNNLAINGGARIWFGRRGGSWELCPAVEYLIDPHLVRTVNAKGESIHRELNTAVCAAFYDTGVSFPAETAMPGTKVCVHYRYTGYPLEEARELFETAKVQDNPRIDPEHHFVFARDQWPTIRFDNFVAMDKPWWGGRPFMSGHNARPAYHLVKMKDGRPIMRLGPLGYGVASVGPARLEAGRYLVSARVKSINTHGPGGRLEILGTKKPVINGYLKQSADNILKEENWHLGRGTFDWRTVEFVTEVPAKAPSLGLGLGNGGTGDLLVSEVTFRRLEDGENPPPTAGAHVSSEPPGVAAVDDAIWDFRMEEQSGLHVYNFGSQKSYRTLELANLDWVVDEGRPALRFTEPPGRDVKFARDGHLERDYLRRPETRSVPAGIGGHHGGGSPVDALTIAAWIKPAAQMGNTTRGISQHGDVVGLGARRFILSLTGREAPYRLQARLNVNDRFTAELVEIPAGKWTHVAMTCAADSGRWKVRLFVDGNPVSEGRTESFAAPVNMPPSIILGAEIFYLHDAFFRGLIGRTLVFDRALADHEVEALTER